MSWTEFGTRLDTRVAGVAERAVRRLSRRQALRTAVVGGATGLATLAVGQRPAFAVTCDCGPTVRCSGCPNYGCPSGYSLCKLTQHPNCCNNAYHADCCNSPCCSCSNGTTCKCPCAYPSGQWVACSGLGHGNGYRLCYDCLKGNNGANCGSWCTCLSLCICCQCLKPQQVRAEARRVQEIVQAQEDLVLGTAGG
jgi:hypothetical protein